MLVCTAWFSSLLYKERARHQEGRQKHVATQGRRFKTIISPLDQKTILGQKSLTTIFMTNNYYANKGRAEGHVSFSSQELSCEGGKSVSKPSFLTTIFFVTLPVMQPCLSFLKISFFFHTIYGGEDRITLCKTDTADFNTRQTNLRKPFMTQR